jgi:hypothetical protein
MQHDTRYGFHPQIRATTVLFYIYASYMLFAKRYLFSKSVTFPDMVIIHTLIKHFLLHAQKLLMQLPILIVNFLVLIKQIQEITLRFSP